MHFNLITIFPELVENYVSHGIIAKAIEAKKLYHFIEGADNDTPKVKKENMFIQMLEGLHESEARLVIAAKDKKLHQVYKGLSKEVVKEAFNWNDDFVNPNS